MAPREAMPGQNPPYGASIDYFLKDASKEKVEVTILGPDGQKIRTLETTNKPGLNRTWWDLRYEPTRPVELRATPPGNPHIWEEKRFAGQDTRPVFYYGVGRARSRGGEGESFMRSTTGEPTLGPLAAPGVYTVRLSIGSEQITQKLTVLKDPNTGATDKDVADSSTLALKVYNDANTSVALINQIEWIRRQIDEMKKMLAADPSKHHLIESANALDTKFRAVEEPLLDETIAEGDQKSFRGPLGLYLKFVWLGAEVGTGGADVSGNSDFPPTQSEIEVFDLLNKQLEESKVQLKQLNDQGLSAFNKEMQNAGALRIAVPQLDQQ